MIPAQRRAVLDRAAAGQYPRGIAADLGVSSAAVYRVARREGVPLRNDGKVQQAILIHDLRAAVLDMPPGQAVEFLMDWISARFAEQDAAALGAVMGAGFTPAQARLLLMLAGAPGPLSRDQMHGRLYGHDPGGGADPKTISVFVSQLRRRIKALGWGLEIRTVQGFGYELKRPAGPWPWEAT